MLHLIGNDKLTKTLFDVQIVNNTHPTTGNFLYEIKHLHSDELSIDASTGKIILIYKKDELIGSCMFKRVIPFSWTGNPRHFWDSPVAKCSMIKFAETNNCVFTIILAEDKSEKVTLSPFLPKLLAAAKATLKAKEKV